jgi:phosphonate metabolism protein PhnN/1,5-bisphosphokinase (PRPP-forming)
MTEAGEGGVLILIAGPSGAGKDTLIAHARHALAGNPAFVFPRRFITRADVVGEDHTPVSEAEFARLDLSHAFFLSWAAHGLSYGIPAAIHDHLDAGRHVVVNVSRSVIGQARNRWRGRTEAILIEVNLEVLRGRLLERGRESPGQIEARLSRAKPRTDQAAFDHTFDNSGPLEERCEAFVRLLLGLAAQSPRISAEERRSA